MDSLSQSLALDREQHHSILSYDDMVAQHQSMLSPQSKTCDWPYQHFALIYLDQDGQVALETSPSVGSSGESIFTPQVRELFLKTASMENPAVTGFAGLLVQVRNEKKQPSVPGDPSRLPESATWAEPAVPPTNLIPCDWQFDSNKRQKRTAKGRNRRSHHQTMDLVLGPRIRRTAIRVGDEPRMLKYYDQAFEAFQQYYCRMIGKAYIKLVEPRKQVNYPYNGRRVTSGSSPGQPADPELTKPKWWPSGVRHKEPDHQHKSERIRLLVHILRELRESHGITAEKLRETGQDVRREIPPEKLRILDEIYNVRQAEERYLKGEILGDTLVHISQVQLTDPEFQFDYSPSSVPDKSSCMMEGSSKSSSRSEERPPALSISLAPTTTTPSYSHDSIPIAAGQQQSFQELCLPLLPPPPCVPASRASSFDGSLSFNSQDYHSSVPSTVVSPNMPAQPFDDTGHSNPPCLPNYLNPPMLVSAPAPTEPSLLWDHSVHAAAPVYPQTY